MGVAPPEEENEKGRCAHCGGRLRSQYRDMHRECEKEFYNPKPKGKPAVPRPLPAGGYPPSRTCPECKRLDNGLYPPKICRYCGVETIENTPRA